MNTNRLPRSNKFQLCAVALALLGGANAFAATSTASATSLAIDPGAAIDTTNGPGAIPGTPLGTGSFAISQYGGGGVLKGASFSAVFAQENITFSSTDSKNSGGFAYGVGGFSVAGVTGSYGSATTTNTPVVTKVTSASPGSGVIAEYTATGTATTQGQLEALYGSNTALAGTVSETLYVDLGGGPYLKADNSFNRTAKVTATYTSVNHANGSFASASDTNASTLNFTVDNNTAPSNITFNLYNLFGSYGLDVKGYTYTASSGGSNPFTLNLIGSDVSGDSSGSFAAGTVGMLAQTVAGDYSGTWDITVADSVSGDGAGKNTVSTDVLHLTVLAHVNAAPVTPVPEPESYAMLLAGLGLMGTIVIRRRGKDNA